MARHKLPEMTEGERNFNFALIGAAVKIAVFVIVTCATYVGHDVVIALNTPDTGVITTPAPSTPAPVRGIPVATNKGEQR